MSNQGTLQVHSVKGWAYDSPLKVGEDGQLLLTYSDDGVYHNRKEIGFPLISAWMDPANPRKTAKMTAAIPQKPKTKDEEALCLIAEQIVEQQGIPFYTTPAMTLTVDLHKQILCYRAKNDTYLSEVNNNYTPIYDNKALALKAIIESLGKYTTARVAGFDLINLNAVGDQVLEELGFYKVPDVLRRGVPMWYGDHEKSLSMGAASFTSSRWSYRQHEANDEMRSSQVDVVNSFLTVLETELSQ